MIVYVVSNLFTDSEIIHTKTLSSESELMTALRVSPEACRLRWMFSPHITSKLGVEYEYDYEDKSVDMTFGLESQVTPD